MKSDDTPPADYSMELRERFSILSYNDLRKEAKANSISGRLKKVEMVEALVRQLSLKHCQLNSKESAEKEKSINPGQDPDKVAAGNFNKSTDHLVNKPKDDDEETNKMTKNEENKCMAIADVTSAPSEGKSAEEIEKEKLSLSLRLSVETNVVSEKQADDDANDVKNISSETYIVDKEMKHNLVDEEEHWISNDQMEVGEEELAQETTIIERADGKNKLSMSEDNCERQQEANQDKNHDLELSRDSELSKLLDEVYTSPKSSQTSKPKSANPSPARSPLMATNSNFRYNRFAMLHAKEFGGMPSITETQERRQQRHAELTSGISAKYKRLASPKKAPRPYKEFMQHEKEKEKQSVPFRFGDGLPTGVAHFGDDQKSNITPAKCLFTPRADVKSQTMSKTPTTHTPSSSKTTPIWSSRINKLAMPKGQKIDLGVAAEEEVSSSMTNDTSRSYTPHRGPYKYVDTTKMSDREFAAYKERMAEKVELHASTPNNATRGTDDSNGQNQRQFMDNNPFEL